MIDLLMNYSHLCDIHMELIDPKKVIVFNGFKSVGGWSGDILIGLKSIPLNRVKCCYLTKQWAHSKEFTYILKATAVIKQHKDDLKAFIRLVSSERNFAFEQQFPEFTYDRDTYVANLLNQKLNQIEQQNIALLSHLETIMTCMRLRAITDDNLDFTLPQNN